MSSLAVLSAFPEPKQCTNGCGGRSSLFGWAVRVPTCVCLRERLNALLVPKLCGHDPDYQN
eukprot:10914567-Alexandrium_andersonii.AAC.1